MRISLALIATLGLVGCVGGLEGATDGTDDPNPAGPGGGGSGQAAIEAKQQFEANVYPIISSMCVGCHSASGPNGNVTGFVATTLSNAYATATGFQALVGNFTSDGAPIVTKIMGTSKTPSHQPIMYQPDQLTKITDWLSKELEARGATSGGNANETAGEATERLLNEWSGCMTQINFEAADMRAWGNVNANGQGDCKTCHTLGEYGFIAATTSTNFFPYISTDKYYMLQYFSVDLSMGVANAKIIVNDRSFEGVGTRTAPHQQHGNFDPTNNDGYAALTAFYTSTMNAKIAAPGGVCGPSKLTN